MKSTAKATEKRSRTVVVLAIAVALMLLGSIFLLMPNTDRLSIHCCHLVFPSVCVSIYHCLFWPAFRICLCTKGIDLLLGHIAACISGINNRFV